MTAETRPAWLPPLRSPVSPLPDYVFPLAGDNVREPSLAYTHALQDHVEAQRAAARAVEAIGVAQEDDRLAAIEAARGGKPPPKPTVGAAREAAESATRSVAAAEHLAREEMARFLGALAEHRDELEQAADAEVEQIRASLLPSLDDLQESLLRLAGLRSLIHELDLPSLQARAPAFQPRKPAHLVDSLRDAIEGLRTELVGAEPAAARDFEDE